MEQEREAQRGNGHTCWSHDVVLTLGTQAFGVVTRDSAQADAFISPFYREYCPVAQMRLLRLREMASQRTLSSEGDDLNMAQPRVWPGALLSFNWPAAPGVWLSVCRLLVWRLCPIQIQRCAREGRDS